LADDAVIGWLAGCMGGAWTHGLGFAHHPCCDIEKETHKKQKNKEKIRNNKQNVLPF